MGVRGEELLFYKYDLDAGLRNEISTIPKVLDDISEERFRDLDDAQAHSEVRRALALPLVLSEDQMTMTSEDIQVDVSGDPMRMGFFDGRRILVPGFRVRVSIPFEGTPDLWQCKTNPYSSMFPRGAVTSDSKKEGGTLILTFEQPADKAEELLKASLDEDLRLVRECVARQARQFQQHEPLRDPVIDAAIAARRDRLGKRGNLSALLGIKAAVPPTTAAGRPDSRTITRTGRAAPQKWDAFISHASEDKEDFARPLAQALRARGFEIWFDEFTLTLGDSLRRSIDKGLATSKYGVVVLSPPFFAKSWPQKELDGLVARESGGHKVILPVLHNMSQAELLAVSPTLADRLWVPSSKGVEAIADEISSVLRSI